MNVVDLVLLDAVIDWDYTGYCYEWLDSIAEKLDGRRGLLGL